MTYKEGQNEKNDKEKGIKIEFKLFKSKSDIINRIPVITGDITFIIVLAVSLAAVLSAALMVVLLVPKKTKQETE